MDVYTLRRYYCVYTIERGLLVRSNVVNKVWQPRFDTVEEAEQAIMDDDIALDDYIILPVTEKRWSIE
jgi:hypothetical protein